MRPNEPLRKEVGGMTIRGDIEPDILKVDIEDGLPDDHPDHKRFEVEPYRPAPVPQLSDPDEEC